MSWVVVGGVRLYYEGRGDGPSVLFISGATGDAGHWTGVADVLAPQYTVVTYDRRGNSRSPRPAEWTTTTIEEQADDAAGLLEALDLAPAIVFWHQRSCRHLGQRMRATSRRPSRGDLPRAGISIGLVKC
jgi:pimeloyl-ACP methyl ester carboxylesterase